MNLIALISSYKEGPLIQAAIRSVSVPQFDRVLIYEGRAGKEEVAGPDSDLRNMVGAQIVQGSWPTDAAKRTQMVKACQRFGAPTWGLWLDGDEVLMQGEFLRDHVQALQWRSEQEEKPYVGMPLRIVEMDGSVAIAQGRVVRVDLIDNYIVSSGGIKFKGGHIEARGNTPQTISSWVEPRLQSIRENKLYLEPPLPGEPFILHRSPLRHPDRQGVRMHEQEADELKRLGLLG